MKKPNNIQEDADDLVQIRFLIFCVVSFAEFEAENTISHDSDKPVWLLQIVCHYSHEMSWTGPRKCAQVYRNSLYRK